MTSKHLDILDLDVVDEAEAGARDAHPGDLSVGSSIPIHEFLSFVRSLEGVIIQTLAGRAQFTVKVLDNGLEFTPLSTKQPRGDAGNTVVVAEHNMHVVAGSDGGSTSARGAGEEGGRVVAAGPAAAVAAAPERTAPCLARELG